MLYAFSRISDSVILNRVCAGEPGFVRTESGPDSFLGLGESSRLGQGGIAQLSMVNCKGMCLHEAQVEHRSARELANTLRLTLICDRFLVFLGGFVGAFLIMQQMLAWV
jgi:hypothetical protein